MHNDNKTTDGTTYNGWTNYPTWALNMWLSNDQGTYDVVNGLVRDAGSVYDASDAIEKFAAELAPELEGFPADLYAWAVGQVDWREIANSWADDLEIERDASGKYALTEAAR